MNILLLADFDSRSGTGTYLRRVVPFLSSKGHVHAVFSHHSVDARTRELFRSYHISFSENLYISTTAEHFVMRCFRRVGLLHWYSYVRDWLCIMRILRVYKPDICFASQCGGARFFPLLHQNVPAVVVCHSLWVEHLSDFRWGHLFRKLLAKNFTDNAKRVVTVSEYAKRIFLRDVPGCFEGITSVIPNYADVTSAFVGTSVPQKKRKKACVLTLGHLTEYKNPDVWLAVAQRVQEVAGFPIHFVWAGVPARWSVYERRFAQVDAASFLGFIGDVEKLYSQADVYFQPSILESQGIAVIEAMSRGIPCVVSNAGGLPESVDDGKEGFVRAVDDIEGFAEALVLLFSDSDLHARMADAAIRKCKQKFSKEQWLCSMDNLFALTLKEKKVE